MEEVKKIESGEEAAILQNEDEVTLAAIDRGLRSAAEGRVVGSQEARQRLQQWLTESSTPKTR